LVKKTEGILGVKVISDRTPAPFYLSGVKPICFERENLRKEQEEKNKEKGKRKRKNTGPICLRNSSISNIVQIAFLDTAHTYVTANRSEL
jgi:hypothetical protein